MHEAMIGKQRYALRRGSDVVRDGLFIELFADNFDGQSLAEVFYSDERHEMMLTGFRDDIPLDAVDWLIAQAKLYLPPATRSSWYDNKL